jgi:hypothetical protein
MEEEIGSLVYCSVVEGCKKYTKSLLVGKVYMGEACEHSCRLLLDEVAWQSATRQEAPERLRGFMTSVQRT